jgi:four helix bundle protein
MQNFRKLHVWKKSHQLALDIYSLAPQLQRREAWPLRDQMFRAAISIPSNIAEGTGRGSDPDFRRFLWTALGSCNELDAQLLLTRDLQFISGEVHTRVGNGLSEVGRMLIGLIQSLQR